MDMDAAATELAQIAREQGFAVEELAAGRWRLERGPHHIIASLDTRVGLHLCVSTLLSDCGLRRTPQVAAFLTRWRM